MLQISMEKILKDYSKNSKKSVIELNMKLGLGLQIDNTTQMFMQKILNVWISEGKEIDEEKFWFEVDHNKQFTHSVEYYERQR